ncbi:histidine kinase [uncultured Corynebacterium sp.]|uniref:sensor histidine kinase n=1 Tax=uncultured Corynebacterium sp. TaxID=159447 RepID=UPI00259A9B49|nr:histidine kinase [uncultured Corynebacterium sp.]
MTMQRWRVAGMVALCVIAGLVTGIVFTELDRQEFPGATEEDVGTRLAQMLAVAVVGWLCLPKALWHDPREAHTGFRGTRGSFLASLVVVLSSTSYFAVPAGVVALISVFSRRSWRWSLAAVVCVGVSGLSDVIFSPLPGMGAPTVAMWAVGTFSVVALTALIAMFRSNAREQQLREVAEAREEARVARQAERNRIARDVHDSLSHRLSLITLHAGALASRDDLPRARVAEASELIRGEAEAAVEDLRRVLRALDAGDPAPQLEELIASAEAAGTPVTVSGDTDLAAVSPQVRTVVARAVQEGLTNARKHAPGEPVDLRVVPAPDGITVEMSNPAKGAGDGAAGPGRGLAGMRQRAEQVGGALDIVRANGQFRWRMHLGAEEGAAR